MVFQSYALFPNLTALENIEYGLKTKKYGKAEVKEKALDALKLVDLLNVKDKYPAQMFWWTTAASSTCTCARSVSRYFVTR